MVERPDDRLPAGRQQWGCFVGELNQKVCARSVRVKYLGEWFCEIEHLDDEPDGEHA